MGELDTTDAGSTQRSVARHALGRTIATADVAPGSLLGTDLVLGPGPNGRDFVFVSGVGALAQDLKTAVLTPLGDELLHQSFGFEGLRVLGGAGGVRYVEEMLRLSAMRVVATDNRISRVIDAVIERTDPERRSWRISVTAQTVLDDIVDLQLGEVTQHG